MSYTPEKHHHHSNWNASLCGCFDDCESCIFSFFCPCIQFGRNAEASGMGDCFMCGLGWVGLSALGGWSFILGCLNRTRLREKWGIEGSSIEDCMCHVCCVPCALSQEAREVKHRGHLVHGGH